MKEIMLIIFAVSTCAIKCNVHDHAAIVTGKRIDTLHIGIAHYEYDGLGDSKTFDDSFNLYQIGDTLQKKRN